MIPMLYDYSESMPEAMSERLSSKSSRVQHNPEHREIIRLFIIVFLLFTFLCLVRLAHAAEQPSADFLAAQAVTLFDEGREDEALTRFRAALEQDPAHAVARRYVQHIVFGDDPYAVKDAEKDRNPGFTHIETGRVRLAHKDGEVQRRNDAAYAVRRELQLVQEDAAARKDWLSELAQLRQQQRELEAIKKDVEAEGTAEAKARAAVLDDIIANDRARLQQLLEHIRTREAEWARLVEPVGADNSLYPRMVENQEKEYVRDLKAKLKRIQDEINGLPADGTPSYARPAQAAARTTTDVTKTFDKRVTVTTTDYSADDIATDDRHGLKGTMDLDPSQPCSDMTRYGPGPWIFFEPLHEAAFVLSMKDSRYFCQNPPTAYTMGPVTIERAYPQREELERRVEEITGRIIVSDLKDKQRRRQPHARKTVAEDIQPVRVKTSRIRTREAGDRLRVRSSSLSGSGQADVIRSLQKRIHDLEEQLADVNTKREAAELPSISAGDDPCAEEKVLIGVKEQRIVELEAELQDAEMRWADMRVQISDAEMRLLEQSQMLEQRNSDLDLLRSGFQDLQARLALVKEIIAEKDTQIQLLREEISRLQDTCGAE